MRTRTASVAVYRRWQGRDEKARRHSTRLTFGLNSDHHPLTILSWWVTPHIVLAMGCVAYLQDHPKGETGALIQVNAGSRAWV